MDQSLTSPICTALDPLYMSLNARTTNLFLALHQVDGLDSNSNQTATTFIIQQNTPSQLNGTLYSHPNFPGYPRTVNKAKRQSDPEWKAAMYDELSCLNERNAWDIVDAPLDTNIID
ncbi:hypothetical protein CPB83DRAFT_922549, partial [Crepidotus variabilis]